MTLINCDYKRFKNIKGKKGFIPLLRKPFRDSQLLRSGAHELLALLLFLIFEASPGEKKLQLGSFQYTLKRGMLVRSQASLAEIFRCNRKTIYKLLRRLVELREISMEARTFKEYKRVTVFRVLRYDNYVWQTEAHFQDMKALVGLGGFLPIDREHILAMKEIRRKNCHEWVLLIYLCMVAFHSPTEVEFPDGRLRLEKGQVKVDVDHLAAFISKDKSAVIVLLKTLARKKLISLKKKRHQTGPETLIVTVDTFDHFSQNLKKMDNAVDNALGEGTEDGEAAGLATSDNVVDNFPDNSEKMTGKNTGELPAVVHTPTSTQQDEANAEEAEKEKIQLVDEIMSWTYDEQNGFYEQTAPETLREQLAHVVNRLGVQVVNRIFDSVVEGKPWGDYSFENKCALTEFWNRLKLEQRRIERPAPKIIKVPEKKYIQMEDPLREAIFLLEQLNSIFGEKLGIETVAVCLLLDKNYIGWTGYSLGQFKEEHAEVLGISTRTMHRIIARLLRMRLLEKDEATNRVRFNSLWYSLKKRFIEKTEENNGGKNGKKDGC